MHGEGRGRREREGARKREGEGEVLGMVHSIRRGGGSTASRPRAGLTWGMTRNDSFSKKIKTSW